MHIEFKEEINHIELHFYGESRLNGTFNKRYTINYDNPELVFMAEPKDLHIHSVHGYSSQDQRTEQFLQNQQKIKPLLTILENKINEKKIDISKVEKIYTIIKKELNNEPIFKNAGKILDNALTGKIQQYKDSNLID